MLMILIINNIFEFTLLQTNLLFALPSLYLYPTHPIVYEMNMEQYATNIVSLL